MIPATGKDQRHRHTPAIKQEQPGIHALNDPAVTDLHVDIAHRTRRDRSGRPRPGENFGQPDRAEPHMPGRESHQFGVREHRVERQLEIRVVGQRKLGARRRQLTRVGPEMPANAPLPRTRCSASIDIRG